MPLNTVGQFLTTHGYDRESSAPLALSRSVFPKFLSRVGSHAFRFHGSTPRNGMLQHLGRRVEPYCDIRALAMGFSHDHLTTQAVTDAERHRLLGSCIEGSISAWLVNALFALAPTPSAWFSVAPT